MLNSWQSNILSVFFFLSCVSFRYFLTGLMYKQMGCFLMVWLMPENKMPFFLLLSNKNKIKISSAWGIIEQSGQRE